MLSLIFIPLSIIIFLKLNRHYQFLIFSLAALYPFTFGDLRSISDLLVIEWLTIVVFLSLINQLVPLYSIDKRINNLKFKGIGIFIFALSVLIIWVIISYINNEILSQKIMSGGETGIKRTYFGIFNNILIFFTTVIFFATQYEKISVEKLLKTILYITIIIGLVRIFTFYYQIETPLLSGSFTYNTWGTVKGGTVAQRFSGLDIATIIGIPALFALFIYRNKINLLMLFILLIFLFLSGSRTTLIGVIFSMIVFSFFLLPKNFIYLFIAGSLLFIVVFLFLPQSFFEGQLTRLSTFKDKGFMGQDIWRGTAWYLYLKSFIANPIFGKGISEYTAFIYSQVPLTESFARQQLFAGGHGAYFSLLGILGLGGIIYFIIMLFGGIILSFKKIKHYVNANQDKSAIAIFCFMLLLIVSLVYITGFDGLTDVQILFYIVGLICSIRVMENFPLSIKELIK